MNAATDTKSADRTERFMARVNARVASLPERKRLSFLIEQIGAWESRYQNFIATDGKSEPITDTANPPKAADFLMTITALCALRDKLKENRS